MSESIKALSSSSKTVSRLERLEKYLLQDPQNPALLADACEAAIASGRHDRARAHLDRAEALGLDRNEWDFRRARLCIAARELDQARQLLEGLRTGGVDHPAVAHDLAYMHFLQGELESCRIILHPWLSKAADTSADDLDALQALWLRATHRLHHMEEAWGWIEQQQAAGTLQATASGVASLVGVDTSHFEAARQLAERALATDPEQPEALVARATVAMAEDSNEAAQQLLQRALQAHPEDGRIWSALAFASLQAGDLSQAAMQFEHALASSMREHVGTWHGLGWTRLLQGDRPGALAAFSHALDLDRNFAESHGAVGLLLGLQGNGEQAQHHLRVADKLNPDNVTGRFARAVLAGEAANPAQIRNLAAQIFQRPGFLEGSLSDSVSQALARRR